MKSFLDKTFIDRFIKAFAILIIGYSCSNYTHDENKTEYSDYQNDSVKTNLEIAVSPPPFSDEYIFPCSSCHEYQEPNSTRRDLLDMHDEISREFNHDSENRWCLDCHDEVQRDSLRLASGKLLRFEESYKLCGQCHGDKLRDWKVGVHGKRSGEWNGQKHYLLCVHCHNPHSPKFKAIKPSPPPVRQEDIF